MLLDQVGDHVVAEFADQFRQVRRVHELLALLEHGLALVVHDVVVLQQVLADVVVAGLDPLLGGLDGAVQPGVADGLALGHAQPHLVEALKTQADKVSHLSNLNEVPGQEELILLQPLQRSMESPTHLHETSEQLAKLYLAQTN